MSGNIQIYQCEAHRNTLRSTAQNFVQTYWDKPRTVKSWKQVSVDVAHFTVVDGTATYQVSFLKGIKNQTLDLYVIERIEKVKNELSRPKLKR